MGAIRSRSQILLGIFGGVLAATILGFACGPSDDPFDFGQRKEQKEGTPTPPPEVDSSAATNPAQPLPTVHPDDLEALGTIRLASWDDKTINLENMLAGYIMTHGFNYVVELVETPGGAYHDALSKGDVDVVLQMSKGASAEWYRQQTGSGAVIDTGSLRGIDSDVRIGVHSTFKERAPEVVGFLQKMRPGEKPLADLAARITAGFVGVKPNTAAMIYLKNSRDEWSQWVPASVAGNVDSAIERGKTGLRRGRCLDEYDGGCRTP